MKTLCKFMLILLVICAAEICKAQAKIESVNVLQIDSTERVKIEQWTESNTFPNVIKFIKDAKGNYIVGVEVLGDSAYQKIFADTTKKLRDYINQKSTLVVYDPVKTSDAEEIKKASQ